jgi:hypothetical protein
VRGVVRTTKGEGVIEKLSREDGEPEPRLGKQKAVERVEKHSREGNRIGKDI